MSTADVDSSAGAVEVEEPVKIDRVSDWSLQIVAGMISFLNFSEELISMPDVASCFEVLWRISQRECLVQILRFVSKTQLPGHIAMRLCVLELLAACKFKK